MSSNDPKSHEEDDGLPHLMQSLANVDENDPATAQNDRSISDNRGGRIELDDNSGKAKNVIRGGEKTPGTIR